MAPTTQEKKKHVYEPPQWIAEIDTSKLPADKAKYWENRKKGTGRPAKPEAKVFKTPDNVQTGFMPDGSMYAKTRAIRRKQPPTDSSKTKKTLTKAQRKVVRKKK